MKKKVRDKRGFTLIELLVVIALMLSILGIAVVSFVGISNKKKESSKELIKEQIETAALEYFNANEFLFSNLKDDVFGVISVGKLVNDDYLNVVTNPVTGKRIGNCTVVVVKRKNNVFTSDVDDESFENATDNQTGTQLINVCDSILVSSDDIQGGKITYYDENYKKLTEERFEDLSDNKKLWFNSKHLGKDRNLIACSKDEVKVTNTKGEEIKVEKNSHGYCATIKNGTNEDITYRPKDRSWTLIVAERVDTTPPKVSNLKVESENSYIGSKRLDEIEEYRSKFYSFKLIPEMPGKKSILTYSDAEANRIRKSVDLLGHRRTNDDYSVNGQLYYIKNSRDSEDIIVDGKLMMLKNQHRDNDEDIPPEIVDKMLPDLKDNGIYLISSRLDKKDSPKDITDYHNNRGIRYALNREDNYINYCSTNGQCFKAPKEGEEIENEHIVDNEIRKVYKDYLYYTKQKILCKISAYKGNICSKIIEAYPKTINVSTAGLDNYCYYFVNYNKEINGQLTKVSFKSEDDISKVYSYKLDKKYAKKVKKHNIFGDLESKDNLTKRLQNIIKSKNDVYTDKNLYSYSYTTDKSKSLKGEGLNEEYNKEVLNSVEIYDFKQSKDNYEKERVNKKEESVEINHIYSFEDNSESKLDGSISNYKLAIKDNAGNETTSEENYEKYKICTYTKQKVWNSPVDEESCEDVCNSHGTLVTKRGLGMVAWVDEVTGEFCSEPEFFGEDEVRTPNSPECPWTDCTTPSPTPNKPNQPNQPNEPEEYTRKAFKFSEMDNFCSNKSVVSFSNCNSSDSSLNCRPNYPYKRYKFQELECSCTNDNGNITATSKDITETTHPDEHSYIFYTSESNCNKSASEGKNNVIQVCQHKVGDYLDFHGVYWNQGSANRWSGEGWYNNNYVSKKSVDAFTSEKEACKWACQE